VYWSHNKNVVANRSGPHTCAQFDRPMLKKKPAMQMPKLIIFRPTNNMSSRAHPRDNHSQSCLLCSKALSLLCCREVICELHISPNAGPMTPPAIATQFLMPRTAASKSKWKSLLKISFSAS